MRTTEKVEQAVRLVSGDSALEGNLLVPENAIGLVLFAHGSGSSRFSPRNRYVAQVLQEAGLGTLLLDLLTPAEEGIDEQTAQLRFDIGFLARRLVSATDWLLHQPATHRARIGYFGASTGAGAALVAAAERPEVVRAVVSRGGRPDLAHSFLPHVKAPTLLIVGASDPVVWELNQEALNQMTGIKQLAVIPGATHLFVEPGALEQVAQVARDWFARYLGSADNEILQTAAAPTRDLDQSKPFGLQEG